jgi:tRNA uridine 5-carboxymethylaminomethyl modification enzyme
VLQHFRPATLGQAGRLAGVNPSDVAILFFALERRERGQRASAPEQPEQPEPEQMAESG